MEQLLPTELYWVLWALRVQAWVGLAILLWVCYQDWAKLKSYQTVSFVLPVVCLFVYYTYIIFFRATQVTPVTYGSMFYAFSLAWFFLGFATMVSEIRRETQRLVKQTSGR